MLGTIFYIYIYIYIYISCLTGSNYLAQKISLLLCEESSSLVRGTPYCGFMVLPFPLCTLGMKSQEK